MLMKRRLLAERGRMAVALGNLLKKRGSELNEARSISETRKIPLSLAMEMVKDRQNVPLSTPRFNAFMQKLKSEYTVQTRHGWIWVRPSLWTISGQYKRVDRSKIEGMEGRGLLNRFAAITFRISPLAEELGEYRGYLRSTRKHNLISSPIGIELGFVEVNGRPAIVVTCAQAKEEYYRLPWKLKKRFKGAYEKTLEIIRQAGGNVPVLIPSNATVLETLKANLGHTAPKSALDEFYDGYCRNRNRQTRELKITNQISGREMSGEFWLTSEELKKLGLE